MFRRKKDADELSCGFEGNEAALANLKQLQQILSVKMK